jgi:hypothetical protein
MMRLFSGPYFKRRLDQDYVSHMFEYAREMGQTMKEIGKNRSVLETAEKVRNPCLALAYSALGRSVTGAAALSFAQALFDR